MIMTDYDQTLKFLVRKAKAGDDQAFKEIIKILDPDLKKISNKYYIVGSDDSDVLQECRIGVWKAIKDFDENGGMTFRNFSVNLCVKRHLITAMSHANTLKFRLQNEAISLSAPTSQSDDDGTQTYADCIPDPSSDLLGQYIAMEEFSVNFNAISGKLTELELSILNQYAVNSSYKDIANSLNVKPKTVDNALMRIRKKSSDTFQRYRATYSVINYGITSSVFSTSFIAHISVGITTQISEISIA